MDPFNQINLRPSRSTLRLSLEDLQLDSIYSGETVTHAKRKSPEPNYILVGGSPDHGYSTWATIPRSLGEMDMGATGCRDQSLTLDQVTPRSLDTMSSLSDFPGCLSPVRSMSPLHTSSASKYGSPVSPSTDPLSEEHLEIFSHYLGSRIEDYYDLKKEGQRLYWLRKERNDIPEAVLKSLPLTICNPAEFEDDRKFLCLVAPCESKTFSFKRKADLERHYATVHGFRRMTYICPKKNCDRKENRPFTREDHLKEHLRQFHREKLPKKGSSQRNSDSDSPDPRGFNASDDDESPTQ